MASDFLERDLLLMSELIIIVPQRPYWQSSEVSAEVLRTVVSSAAVVLAHIRNILSAPSIVLGADLFGHIDDYMNFTAQVELFLSFTRLQSSMTRMELVALADSIMLILPSGKRLVANLIECLHVHSSTQGTRSDRHTHAHAPARTRGDGYGTTSRTHPYFQ